MLNADVEVAFVTNMPYDVLKNWHTKLESHDRFLVEGKIVGGSWTFDQAYKWLLNVTDDALAELRGTPLEQNVIPKSDTVEEVLDRLDAQLGVIEIVDPPPRPPAVERECRLQRLSPTSLHVWERSPYDFVRQYVLNQPRDPQSLPMAIGASFDCRVKAHLAYMLCGAESEESLFTELFESSVEPYNRDWALGESIDLFMKYKECGALADLMLELTGFTQTPQFEFGVGLDLIESEGDGCVPLYGKPDCYFVNAEGAHVIVDWKVNGYMSKASPCKGYIKIRPANKDGSTRHKNTQVVPFMGMRVGYGDPIKAEWEDQLIMYSWMLGGLTHNQTEEPDKWVLGIDQLACNADGDVRVATFRARRNADAAEKLWRRVVTCWNAITNCHYFQDRSKEESDELVEAIAMEPDKTAMLNLLNPLDFSDLR